MKVKVISRNPHDFIRATKFECHRVPRSYDPNLHPFEAAREYTRALNAVKLERVFAKPFVGNLDGHRDSISCLAKHPRQLSLLASGAFDGELRLWDIARRVCLSKIDGHEGIVRGLTFTPSGEQFVSVADDKTIKFWSKSNDTDGTDLQLVNTILSRYILSGISYQNNRGGGRGLFATCGENCQIWDQARNEPLKTFQWGVDSLHDVAFNPIEIHLLSACASDRSIILYDSRDSGPIRKVVMNLRANQVAWNPMEAFTFTCASEDYNLYTFDTRNLKQPTNVHRDHVSAVTCISYAPTGREFVSGSYDKTIRIFECGKGHSREIYHTKRMQRLTTIEWTLDNKYVLSGSDEMNIRIWKANASEKLGPLKYRERAALNYSEALKEKFAAHPQIKRIARHRQVPKHVYNTQKVIRVVRNKEKRKESNRRTHSKPGTVPFEAERAKHVLREDK